MPLLHQAGLVKQKNFKDGPEYIVNVEGWNGLIDKYYLSDEIERVNKTNKLRGDCHCFINIGNKHSKVIVHPPKHQFNRNVAGPSIHICDEQHALHANLAEATCQSPCTLDNDENIEELELEMQKLAGLLLP